VEPAGGSARSRTRGHPAERLEARRPTGPIASAAGNPPANSSAVSSVLIGGKIVEPAPPRR